MSSFLYICQSRRLASGSEKAILHGLQVWSDICYLFGMRHYERTDSTHAAIAGAVRRFRKRANLTQTTLAEAAGLSRATVAAIETGRYGSLTLATLERLAAALEVTEADLIVRPTVENDALEAFRRSPWFGALRPTDAEISRLSLVPLSFWSARLPSPETLSAAIQLMRRHDAEVQAKK